MYPKYATYSSLKRRPTVLDQEFISNIQTAAGKLLYPRNRHLDNRFPSEESSFKFGAAQLSSFLNDTIAVEHCLVIPAVLAISNVQVDVPYAVEFEMYKIATDESHHAAQSLSFINALKLMFGFNLSDVNERPRFLHELWKIRESIKDSVFDVALFDIICGVVTETRVSFELGQFSRDNTLCDSVRAMLRSHQSDEDIHASQFRALGEWIWNNSDEKTRIKMAEFYGKVITRNEINAKKVVSHFSLATGYSQLESQNIVERCFDPDVTKAEMSWTMGPTLRFIQRLGVLEYEGATKLKEFIR